MTRSIAPYKVSLVALALGAGLLAGCGSKSTDMEQAAAAQAAAERAEAAAARAEKAAGKSNVAMAGPDSNQEPAADSYENDDSEAPAGPPQPTEEDVRRALEEAGH